MLGFHSILAGQAVTPVQREVRVSETEPAISLQDALNLYADTLQPAMIPMFNKKTLKLSAELMAYVDMLAAGNLTESSTTILTDAALELFDRPDTLNVVWHADGGSFFMKAPAWLSADRNALEAFFPLEGGYWTLADPFLYTAADAAATNCYVLPSGQQPLCIHYVLRQKERFFGREHLKLWDIYIQRVEIFTR